MTYNSSRGRAIRSSPATRGPQRGRLSKPGKNYKFEKVSDPGSMPDDHRITSHICRVIYVGVIIVAAFEMYRAYDDSNILLGMGAFVVFALGVNLFWTVNKELRVSKPEE